MVTLWVNRVITLRIRANNLQQCSRTVITFRPKNNPRVPPISAKNAYAGYCASSSMTIVGTSETFHNIDEVRRASGSGISKSKIAYSVAVRSKS